MEWLTRLPVIGPLVVRLMRTHLWRAYERLDETHWTRLAAAITFISFLALFPMLALGAAIGAATLNEDRMARLEEFLADQVPGISDEVDIQGLVDNAGTVGTVAALLLLLTGLGWTRSLRECLREVWRLPEEDVHFLLGKVKDFGILVGLGLVGLLSIAGSSFAVGSVDWTVDQLGVDESGPVAWLLRIAPVLGAVLVSGLLLLYLLTRVPGVRPPRRAVLEAAVMGAIGFEVLKLLLGGYLRGVAAKSMYGAFGIPIALLIWISLMARLLLFCTAWTATAEAVADSSEDARDAADPAAAAEETGRPADGNGPPLVGRAVSTVGGSPLSDPTAGGGGDAPPGPGTDSEPRSGSHPRGPSGPAGP
ncbi:YihY/virulence factor BrkB family protein [Streptomyces durbertensis]|uniref:YihY/virulence factor BrkB family protein n=1 Tax=Streptomyces durbertensis TaxID=2448886 RepID=A0ABR6EDQ0_9ACTN|nr:YihY/virulence factor BrkB family protein [Streptomyces durbertensis]MBB1243462.1 YihY/virulence factor BrkB family protein [Streptomyces durbertensis]